MDRLDAQEPEVKSMEVEESQGLDIKKVERLAQAKERKERLEIKLMVKDLIHDMVRQVPVKSILEECLSRSVWVGEAGKLWAVMGEDVKLQDEIERRIFKARKERRLESTKSLEKERESRLLRKKVSEELWRRKRLINSMEHDVDIIVPRIKEWRPFCILTEDTMEWAVREAVEHEELNGMDIATLSSMVEVEDDYWTAVNVAETIPDDDYVMTEPFDTTTTYEEWLAMELAEMGIDTDMETACIQEEYNQMEDSISMVNVIGTEETDDDINIVEVMGRPRTLESTVP